MFVADFFDSNNSVGRVFMTKVHRTYIVLCGHFHDSKSCTCSHSLTLDRSRCTTLEYTSVHPHGPCYGKFIGFLLFYWKFMEFENPVNFALQGQKSRSITL